MGKELRAGLRTLANRDANGHPVDPPLPPPAEAEEQLTWAQPLTKLGRDPRRARSPGPRFPTH